MPLNKHQQAPMPTLQASQARHAKLFDLGDGIFLYHDFNSNTIVLPVCKVPGKQMTRVVKSIHYIEFESKQRNFYELKVSELK